MLSTGSISTWDLLKKTFIRKYCPPFKIAKKLVEIQNFKQGMDETLYQAWERYNDLLFRCSQHNLNNHQKVQIFYKGLDIPSRKMADSQGLNPMMPPAKALKSIQNMVVGCKSCERAHLTKERPLNEDGKLKAEQLTQAILTDNMVDKAKTKMRKDIEFKKELVPFDLPNVNPYVEPTVPPIPFRGHLKEQEDEAQAFRMLEGLKKLKIN
ncbi:hypothetical protein Tco_1321111 [Tanacetum coccineum]